MFTGSQSIIIKGSKEQVFKVAATYPYFVRFFKKESKVISEDQNELSVEVHTNLLGILPSTWWGTGIKKPYDRIEFTQTKGMFEGLTALWAFENVDNSTRVTITTTFEKPKLGEFIEGLLGRHLVEKTTKKILAELQNAVAAEIK